MFGSNPKKETGKSAAPGSTSGSPNAFNTLVQGTIVEGTVKSDSDIRVDGVIKGKLHCDAKLVIGPSGVIEGEIRCVNAVIEGKFQGTLVVTELLNVRETANISGDVNTGKLIVQAGAVFNVNCVMGGALTTIPANPAKNPLKEEKGVKAAEV